MSAALDESSALMKTASVRKVRTAEAAQRRTGFRSRLRDARHSSGPTPAEFSLLFGMAERRNCGFRPFGMVARHLRTSGRSRGIAHYKAFENRPAAVDADFRVIH